MENKNESGRKSIKAIHPYANNPRKNDDAVEQVANSIREFGFKVPIIIDKNGEIVTGHTRLKAAKKLGMDKVPCIVADDLTEEQIRAYRLADNKVAEKAEWDFNMLPIEMDSVGNIDMTIFGDWGLDGEEYNADDFGESFELADGERDPWRTMTFTVHEKQKEAIESALNSVKESDETFGNTNRNGNKLYEVIKEWEKLRILR